MNITTTRQGPSDPQARLTDQPLPPYSYVSGKFPHPTRDLQGHSYGAQEPEVSIGQAAEWPQCEPYLRGVELFNHGYYWEAHESWEAVWHAAGRKGTMADFCKAFIKLAAAGVKAREGKPDGVQRHARRAMQLLESIARQLGTGRQSYMGLTLPALIEAAEGLVRDPAAVMDTSDQPVAVVMPFPLRVARLT